MEEGYNIKKFLRSPIPFRFLPYVLLVLSGLGFLDSAYLTIEHYQHVIPPCTLHGCDFVLTSNFATIFGIPIALIGAAFYLFLILLTAIFIQTKKQVLVSFLFLFATAGFGVGLFLIYVQAAILHAFCQYCLFSELIDFLLFDTAWWMWNSLRKEN